MATSTPRRSAGGARPTPPSPSPMAARWSRQPRGSSDAPATADEDDAEDDARVYRPLLFQSKGYASSELFRDSYEMRTRMASLSASSTSSPTTRLLGAIGGSSRLDPEDPYALLPPPPSGSDPHQHAHGYRTAIDPQIRLETLSSRAALCVLWLTYLSFFVALALPYLQRQGYLETVIALPGGLCQDHQRGPEPRAAAHTLGDDDSPCMFVDKSQDVARWSAFVNNVSWYAGTIEVRVDIRDLVNGSSLNAMAWTWEAPWTWPPMANHVLSQENASDSTVNANANANPNAKVNAASTALRLDVLEESFALHYDVYLYGVDFATSPLTKEWIKTEYNQSVWVTCHSRAECEPARLVEVTQDLGGTGYGSYLVTLIFKGMYPNEIGKNVTYEFAYTKPVIHVSELILRAGLLAATTLTLPCWVISVVNFHGSWSETLPVHKWVLALGIVLMLWQNPVYAAVEWYRSVSARTRFVADTCESLAQSFFYVFWLRLMDYHGGVLSLLPKLVFGVALFGTDMAMTLIRMPKTEDVVDSASVAQENELYTLLGFVRVGLLLTWLVWIFRITWRTRLHLRTLSYMTSRFQQLSYRFLFIETLLILLYVLIVSGSQVYYLLKMWYLMGFDAFVQASVQEFAKTHSSRPSLGKLLFLSVYVYLMMFVHLPPSAGEGTGFLASTAYHVLDRPRLDHYGFLTPDSHLFCVETAKWLLDIAWQAYFDPPGTPSPSGYGQLKLEDFGFELVSQVRGQLTDTYVLVAVSPKQNRLVIAFRGTTSKMNWKSNLKFHQEVLWIRSKGKTRGRTCMERFKDAAAKVPLLNMALPRVHSGFWNAYASVRQELKEVIRLVLDENPGVAVYVTGHSMGGSLAILAAYDLAENMSMKVTMYNFGGPRVGNPSFVRLYNGCCPTSYRVVMDGDIVPGVPDFWGLYQHVGTEIALDLEGNLIVDPSVVEKKLHVSSKHRVATHPTHVYRASMAKCLEGLLTASH